jgi:hypothetical protein
MKVGAQGVDMRPERENEKRKNRRLKHMNKSTFNPLKILNRAVAFGSARALAARPVVQHRRLMEIFPKLAVALASMVFAFSSTAGGLGNISGRVSVGTNDGVLVGGFIVGGTLPKQLVLRALGPTLTQFGVTDALPNPTLELRNSTGQLLAFNDNWGEAANAQSIPTNFRPLNGLESAILTSLNPGSYTVIVRGVNSTSGVALVEVYDIAPPAFNYLGDLINVSARGLVQTDSNVMIAGITVLDEPYGVLYVIIRALGPTLGDFGITNPLANPTLELRDQFGNLLASNDDWKTTQEETIIATGKAPPNDLESAIFRGLRPGQYTAIVGGANNTTGVALVEVYVQAAHPLPPP